MTTEAELIVIIERELMDLASNFDADNYADAVDDAERDCGFTLPQSTSFKVKWLKERTKRHLFNYLLTGQFAESFQYKQAHLEHQFDHFLTLIKKMDDEFQTAITENAFEFAGVSASQMFGTKIDAGFQYNEVGEETTYTDDNEVIFTPTETD